MTRFCYRNFFGTAIAHRCSWNRPLRCKRGHGLPLKMQSATRIRGNTKGSFGNAAVVDKAQKVDRARLFRYRDIWPKRLWPCRRSLTRILRLELQPMLLERWETTRYARFASVRCVKRSTRSQCQQLSRCSLQHVVFDRRHSDRAACTDLD